MAGRFIRWTTEGQLATLVMAVMFFTWLGVQLFLDPTDRPGLASVANEAFLLTLGMWITNLSYGVKKAAGRNGAAKKDEDA